MKKYPFDLTKIVLIAIIAILLGLLTNTCHSDLPGEDVSREKDSLKNVIAHQKHVADSLKLLADKDDSVRTEYITYWRTKIKTIIQHDSIPCDSVLPIVITVCDSIISKDSIYISDLKKIIKTDSVTIAVQDQMITMDSTSIANLQKEVKKLKRHRRWLLGSTGVLTAVLILTKK